MAADSGSPLSKGLTLFYTDLNRDRIEVREIEKMGRGAVDSNSLFIDELVVPATDRIGEEGEGWKCLLHGINPERILIAAEAVGLGEAALERASRYARGEGGLRSAHREKSGDPAPPWLLIGWNSGRAWDGVQSCFLI